jgi:hypothetical protein
MRTLLALLAGVLFLGSAQAQPRVYDQAELDAMLAPIALHADGVVSQVLIASTYPDEVAAAARWARANPHMRGDDALRAVQNEPWDPAVKALVAFPELLIRMDESPQWLHDLGQAFLHQEPHVMDTVQGLRRRAQAAGNLASTDRYSVYEDGAAIVVQPRTQIVYVPYYDPYVVYGPWWWPHYHPVFWRPWTPRPVFIAHGFWYAKPNWHHRHVHVVHRPVHVHHHHGQHVVPGKWQPHHKHVHHKHAVGKPHAPHVVSKPHVRVPESQRRPIVQSAPISHEGMRKQMPAASGFTQQQHRETVHRHRGGSGERSAPLRQERGGHHAGGGHHHSGAGHHARGGHHRSGGGHQHGGGGRDFRGRG